MFNFRKFSHFCKEDLTLFGKAVVILQTSPAAFSGPNNSGRFGRTP